MRTPPSLLSRARAYISRAWSRMVALARPRSETRRLGLTTRTRVANPGAVSELELMAQSPAIYAALMHRCIGLQVYPLTCYVQSPGGRVVEPIDPATEPWAASLLRLLQRPDPADVGRVFPREPGERLMAQLKADLLMTGTAHVRVQEGDARRIIGLHRLHPGAVQVEYVNGKRVIVYRPATGVEQRFPDEQVCTIALLSWQASAAAEIGVGAAQPLSDITRAEVAAMARTTTAIEQGGVDLAVEATTPEAAMLLMDEQQRERLGAEVTESLGKEGRRVHIPSGGYKLTELGLKPADLRAPETQSAARAAQLMALGVVPVMVGSEAATYATAAAQLRVQYSLDLELVTWLEASLLRPLAQHFATVEGGTRWAGRASRVTCAYDLASHPGALAARSEAIDRALKLFSMGWTAAQAAEAEQLDLPEPEGVPMPAAPAAPTGRPTPAQNGSEPAAPVGQGGRTLGDLFRAEPAVEVPPLEVQRAALWRAADERRAPADAALTRAAQEALRAEEARYVGAVVERLTAATRSWRAEDGEEIDYSGLSAEQVVPPEDTELYLDRLGPSWLDAWAEGAAAALDAIGELGDEVPVPSSSPASLDPLLDTVPLMAQATRRRVVEVVQRGLDAGLTPQLIADELRAAGIFDRSRALSIARTEVVRAESSGTRARYAAAAEAGVELEQEWLSARDGSTRDSHRALDGQRAPVDGAWTFPGGPSTLGPGLSGDPSEDINCRCAVRPVVK